MSPSKTYTLDSFALPWHNGLDVVRGMAPEFRENLGPAELVKDLFARYDQKTLLLDPHTTRRIDLVRVQPGYRDLTNAYHDSVEECLVLTGRLHLDGEGTFVAGDYFWRPAGWIHAASTEDGFTAVLMFQGDDPDEASGPTSRRIRPDNEAGRNGLHNDDLDRALGPRGWIRRQPTGLLAWLPGTEWSASRHRQLAGWTLQRVEVRVLSENIRSGGQSLLLRLRSGALGLKTILDGALDLYVLDGAIDVGNEQLTSGYFLHVPAGGTLAAISSQDGATLLVKSSRWIGRNAHAAA